MLNCRRPASLLATLIGSLGAAFLAQGAPYQETEASLRTHPLPTWFDDAKLGIFIHWGLYSVPGYATLDTVGFDEAQKDPDHFGWYKNNAYAEWYYNSLLIPGSPTQTYHAQTYGKNFNYYQFARAFNAESRHWNPDQWAKLFKETGAGYVVLTTKHHDGFTLWPSAVTNPHLPPDERHAQRDIVGELTQAVRREHLRMGLYYSGVFDWSFLPGPIARRSDEARLAEGQGPDYARYADAQLRELITRYDPDLLWNDIGYPRQGHPREIIADFYNHHPDGVVNDRWKPFQMGDYTTPEYLTPDQLLTGKWEETRGIGRSFGINRLEGERETIAPGTLVHLLIDVVSKNGNLLLDVGPEPDGRIPAIQLDRLHRLGVWLHQNGEAIFATRPWQRAEGKTADGQDVRFTRKGNVLYAILLEKPRTDRVTLLDVPLPKNSHATVLGSPGTLKMAQEGPNLALTLPATLPGQYAWVVKLD